MMASGRARRFGLRLSLVVAACTAPIASVAAQPPLVRDSAGIRIVQNGARLKAPLVFRLGTTPSLEVGGIEDSPEVEFNHNQGFLTGARLSNGGLAVIDTDRLQYFGPDSRRVRVVGRHGRGPQEFLYLTAICRTRGDTVVVADSHNRRFSVVDGSGNVVRTFLANDLRLPTHSFCFSDGTLVLTRMVLSTGFGITRVQLQRVRLDGSVVNQIGDYPSPTFNAYTQSIPRAVAMGQRLYYGDGTSGEVLVLSPSGSLLTIIRSADPRIRITQADAEKRLNATIRPLGSAAERDKFAERLRSRPYPSTWPAYDRIHVAPDGTLWVQDYEVTPSRADSWTAFDSSGRLLGRLLIPGPTKGDMMVEVMGFGTNEILLRRRDSMAAVHLAFYPILRVDQQKQ